MNAPRWLMALAVLLLAASAADAQFVGGFGPPAAFGGVRFGFSRSLGRGSISFGLGFFRGGYYSPPFYPPQGITSTRITVITFAPPPVFFEPGPRPFPFLEGLPPDILPRPRIPEMLPVPPVPPLPAVPEKPKPPEKDKEKKDDVKPKKDDVKPPPPRAKARVDRDLPGRPAPEADPRDEFARLMRAGRERFVEAQYGRAANRFRQASALDPKQPLPYFLLAQSLLEQGSYHDARDAILAGLRRKPDWPATKFRPQELYGVNPEDYSDLLLALERTHARHPDDPVLLLVRGYALWFDGRKGQAAALFRRALKGPDGAAAERFLAALPDEPPL